MEYLNDIWALITLKDDAYKKVANDREALARYIKYYLLVSYIVLGIIMLAIGVFAGGIALAMGKNILIGILIGVLVYLILPLFGLVMDIFGGWLNHFVAKLLGGKARSFWDFYKVYHYPRAAIKVIAIIPIANIASQFYYVVWDFVVLYKSLVNIHKLSTKRAGWFVGIKAGLFVMMMVGMIIAYLGLIFYLQLA